MGAHILVVEDDDDIAETLGAMLARHGYTVTCASNGKQALELVHGGLRPSLIVLDLMMPVMDGNEFLAKARAVAQLGSVPVVVLTAQASGGSFPPQVVAILEKPSPVAAIVEAIHRACAAGAPPTS